MKKSFVSLFLSASLLAGISQANEDKNSNVYDAQRIADIFYTLNYDKNDPKGKVNHAVGLICQHFIGQKKINLTNHF